MRRSLALLLLSATAYAEPAVDVADLPPLPAANEEPSSSAVVLAASEASEDVVVGAAKREQSLGNVASAVTVVSGDRIRRFGYRTVGEAIAGVAGVYLDDNRLVQTVGIRGLHILGDFNTRILVLVDGATVNEPWGSFAGVGYDTFISIDDIARIEVIRGPVSSVYGANAFFGIINIVTRNAVETPHAWGRISVNSINGVISSAGFAQGDVHKQIRGTVQIMDRIGESNTVPEIASTPLKGDGGYQLAASLVGSYQGSFAQLRAYRTLRNDPFAPYTSDPAAPEPYNEYNSQILLEGGHTREINDRLTIAVRGYASIFEYYDHYIQAVDNSTPPWDDYGDGRIYGAEARGRYELLPHKLGVTGGAEASLYQTESHSYQEQATSPQPDPMINTLVPRNFNIEGVYSEVDASPTSWLGATGGVRYDRNSVIDTHVSPRVALFLAQPEKYGLKLLYAEGFRNPSAYEAFFYDGVIYEPAQQLHAETIQSYEAVLWAKPIPGLSTRLSGFYWNADGIVEQVLDMSSNLLRFQNVRRYVSEGIEAEGSYRDASGWYGYAGGTYARVGTPDDTTGQLVYGTVPDSAAWTGAAGISTPKLWSRAHVSTEVQYIGQRPTRDPTITSPAWVDWNWAVYFPNVSGFDITAGVRNLIGTRVLMPAPDDFDRKDYSTMPPTTVTVVPRVPGEGREVYVKVGYSY